MCVGVYISAEERAFLSALVLCWAALWSSERTGNKGVEFSNSGYDDKVVFCFLWFSSINALAVL